MNQGINLDILFKQIVRHSFSKGCAHAMSDEPNWFTFFQISA